MIRIPAPAKINLCLDILKKDKTGYHKIRTVFHEIPEPADELEIHETKESDHVSIRYSKENAYTKATKKCLSGAERAGLPKISQNQNLAYKALKLLKKDQNIKKNATIIIHKNIPVAAGLGGASSNAAATLKGLNKLWDLKLSRKRLLELAKRLGADVPFFIFGGTALGEHYGEDITPLKSIQCVKFHVREMEGRGFSKVSKTERMYNSLDLSKCGRNTQRTSLLLEAIERQDAKQIITNLHNDFETISAINRGEHLSGAGPATFSVV